MRGATLHFARCSSRPRWSSRTASAWFARFAVAAIQTRNVSAGRTSSAHICPRPNGTVIASRWSAVRPASRVRRVDRLVEDHPRLQMVAVSAGAPVEATAVGRRSESHPEVVFAAFGGGRQELFLDRYLGQIGAAAGIGVGGTLDFIAGRVRRAPSFVRRLGMEWAWRLAIQPWRLRRQSVLPLYWWLERREVSSADDRNRRVNVRC